MNIQPHIRLEKLRELGLPGGLFDSLFGPNVVKGIRRYLGEPDYFYAQGYPDKPGNFPELGDKCLLPLWECSDCIYAVDLNCGKPEYIRFHLECSKEYEVLGGSIYSALLAVIEQEVDGGAVDEELDLLIKNFKMPDPGNLFYLLMAGEELDDYKRKHCSA